MSRSFRTARRDALARRGGRGFGVAGEVETGGVRHLLEVEAAPGRTQRRLDGKAADLSQTLPVFSCLAFASARLEIFRGGPDERRRFLDRGVVGVDPGLIQDYRDYSRALRQKSGLLRRTRESHASRTLRQQITAFNERLAGAGSRIQAARRDYVARLQEVLAVAGGPAVLVPGGAPALRYRPSPPAADQDAVPGRDALLQALEERMEDEIRRGHTLAGPQRDDLVLSQGGADLARFGSSGQQRATLIALKIAKMQVHRATRGAYPVLLVDDVDSELDAERTRKALDLLDGPFQAVVASAQGARWAGERPAARHFEVHNGIIGAFN